jgi:D-sedoheptulose 7-phosphate isomerase
MIDITQKLGDHIRVIEAILPFAPKLAELGELMLDSLAGGGKVMWMGNGGSAADSQHLAAELVGRFSRERRALPSVALTTDTSILTAVGNDYGYDKIFVRQIDALCNPGDVVVGISTSGNSPNVIEALTLARERGAHTIGFTGADGGRMRDLVDHCLRVPSTETARIQEAHILIGHLLCDWVEAGFVDRDIGAVSK